jgi:hypothetical protein
VIPVVGCETARELLDAFVDGELTMAQQVAVQAHVRCCRTCSARIEDMSLIGWSIRTGPTATTDATLDVKDLAIMQSGVLARVRAERDQSFRRRLAEWCSDMRLVWPAIGATTAVFLCLIGAGNIWRLTTDKQPNSLAAMLQTAENPGSDGNPLRLEDAQSAPHVLHDGLAFDEEPEGERMVVVSALATQGGRVSDLEVLDVPGVIPATGNGLSPIDDGRDVLNKMLAWQLTPAQSRTGRPVAVRVVYLFAQTTAVKESTRPFDRWIVPPAPPVERTKDPIVPTGTRSALDGTSAAA